MNISDTITAQEDCIGIEIKILVMMEPENKPTLWQLITGCAKKDQYSIKLKFHINFAFFPALTKLKRI